MSAVHLSPSHLSHPPSLKDPQQLTRGLAACLPGSLLPPPPKGHAGGRHSTKLPVPLQGTRQQQALERTLGSIIRASELDFYKVLQFHEMVDQQAPPPDTGIFGGSTRASLEWDGL